MCYKSYVSSEKPDVPEKEISENENDMQKNFVAETSEELDVPVNKNDDKMQTV